MDGSSLSLFCPSCVIWKAKVPPKVTVRAWIIADRKVDTCDRVQRRNLIGVYLLISVLCARVMLKV